MAEELQVAQFQQLFAAAQQQQTSQNGSVRVSADDGVNPDNTADTTTTSTPTQSASAKSAPDDLDEDYDA